MTKSKKAQLRLVIDNTIGAKERFLLKQQKALIKNKILIQNRIKALQKLTEQYGKEIIRIENELLIINRRKINVKRTINKSGDIRTGRNKDKNSNGDVV
tara:strand:+ start:1569 stop:1865 length:297 start_codon:yes stop_codon:yes gene_type:complete